MGCWWCWCFGVLLVFWFGVWLVFWCVLVGVLLVSTPACPSRHDRAVTTARSAVGSVSVTPRRLGSGPTNRTISLSGAILRVAARPRPSPKGSIARARSEASKRSSSAYGRRIITRWFCEKPSRLRRRVSSSPGDCAKIPRDFRNVWLRHSQNPQRLRKCASSFGILFCLFLCSISVVAHDMNLWR